MLCRLSFAGALASLLLGAVSGLAQSPAQPNLAAPPAAAPAFAAPAPAAVQQLYANADEVSAVLYNGPEYVDYTQRYAARDGHQFFLSTKPQPGQLVYRGQPFEVPEMRYDIVLDQVVLEQLTSPLTLRLVNEEVQRFTLAGHRFERVVADSAASGRTGLRTGFYEVLHEGGRLRLLARRAKRQQDRIENRIVTVQFIPTDRLFAQKDGRTYLLDSKKAALALFADRAAETQAYLKQNKLKLRKKQLENVVVLLAAYYDGLPPR